jgi:hypothetical protein
MIGFVVKSPPKPEKRRDGRWHVHIVEITDRLPSRLQRELIREALRRAGFSDVRLDDLTLSSSDLAWWKPREEAKDNGHEGFGRYAAKNAAEHDSETPFAVYRTSNVPGPELPGEDVTREILRAAKASAPKADAPSPRRPVVRAPVEPAPANHQSAQAAQKTIGGLRLPRPLFDPPPTAPKRQPPAPQVIKKSTAWKDLRPKEVRQPFADMLLQSVEVRPRTYVDRYGDPGVCNQWLLVFAGRDGHRYQWPSSRDLVVEAPDGRRYPMDTGLRWNFDAALKVPALPARKSRMRNITRAWSTGSRTRKVLLVHQPEPTRRAYAVKYNIPLHELALEPKAGDRAAGLAESARSGCSDEIDVGLAH